MVRRVPVMWRTARRTVPNAAGELILLYWVWPLDQSPAFCGYERTNFSVDFSRSERPSQNGWRGFQVGGIVLPGSLLGYTEAIGNLDARK